MSEISTDMLFRLCCERGMSKGIFRLDTYFSIAVFQHKAVSLSRIEQLVSCPPTSRSANIFCVAVF